MKLSFWVLVTIFVINGFGLYYDWYHVSWFDILLHFLGSFFVALFLASYLKEHLSSSVIKSILIVIGAAVFIGVLWEFCEYIASKTLVSYAKSIFKYNVYFMGDLDDTIADLLMDILGSFVASVFFLSHSFGSRKAHKTETVPQNYLNASSQD